MMIKWLFCDSEHQFLSKYIESQTIVDAFSLFYECELCKEIIP